jgi:catechol 2,3-dioxygenase-like lactoylglutathione lyase family enzyme
MEQIDAQITFCYTLDLKETASFYEEVLGLELALDQGGCRIYRTAGNAYLGFCEREEAPEPRGVILTLVTDEVDAWYDRLVERGADPEKPPAHNPMYRIYHFFVKDPNGYTVEIQRFDDSDWSD